MPEPRRLRHALVTALAVATSVAVTCACGGIPSSGRVHAGATLDGPPPLHALPLPPLAGATPVAIVRGFLRAGPGLDGDEEVARAYLTGPIAQSWATRPKVVVYPDESSLHIAATAPGTYTVTTPMTASVDENGVYTPAAVGAKATLKLKLSRVFGEWRISSLDNPQTLWLTSYDIDQFYAQVPLYYVAAGTHTLVPDVRWFAQTPGLATVIARAQLAPPPAYLGSAVVTGIPSGTSLVLDSVPTSGSVASIDLNGTAQQPSASDRTMLWAQLAAAVTQAPGVSTVRVLVNGKVLDLPGSSVGAGTTAAALGYTTDPEVTPALAALSLKAGRSVLTPLEQFAGVDSGTTNLTLPVPGVRLRSIARSTDVREFAGVTQNGTQLVRLVNGKTSPVVQGGNLTRPSYDSRHWLWTASSGPRLPTRVLAALTGPGLAPKDVAATVVTPAAPWLAGWQVTALRVSRDGARMLVTSTRHGASRIDIAGIVRDRSGRPVSLSPPLAVGSGLTQVLDGTWVDDTTVAVIARGSTDKHPEPYIISIGAETSELAGIEDPVGIVAGNGASTITVVTAKGQLLSPGGPTGWVTMGAGSNAAFPG